MGQWLRVLTPLVYNGDPWCALADANAQWR